MDGQIKRPCPALPLHSSPLARSMGTRALSLLSALLLLGPCLGQAAPMYFLAAPNILRVGNEENVVLQAHDPDRSLSQDVRVQIRLFDFPKRATVLQEKVVWLSPANGSLAMTTVQVPEQYVSEGTEKQYVVVQATFGDVPLEKYILISPHTGYIFVQTDKPIYTPGQNVNYRVFAVNHRMDPREANCIIAIQSPERITVSRTTRKLDKGLFAGTFHIPEHVSLGSWRIVTRFQSSPRQAQSAEFEVKEYELPSFDVLLTPTKKFFYLSDESLTVTIKARFVFNEPVDGYALAIFGVKTETQKIILQSSLQRVEINDGEGHVTLMGQALRENFAKPEELLDAFIFVNVSVFSSGGDMMQAENSEVKIVSTPYSIRFVRTPGFFKPGMPFNFRVYVTNPDGSPAADVPVCSGDQKPMTKEGLASMVLNTQQGTERLEVQVATCGPLAPPAQQAHATKTILAYETPKGSGHLLHIGVETEAEVGTPLRVLLYTEHQSSAAKQFTILLLSKGRIVRAWTQPRSLGSIMTAWTLDVGPQLLPSFRIVAYYYLPGSTELVADSVWVDVADGCMGTLRVGPQSKDDERKVLRPQRELKLEVIGDPQAMVGLVAMDKALFALNKKNKLTQKKLLTVYHTLPPAREHECQAFRLAVTVEGVPEDQKKHEYIDTFRLRLQARSLGLRDATMTIIDVSLLTGFEPDLGDLKQLTNSVEQYVFLFESKATASNNSVILYFNQISNQTDTEVGFRIHQRLELGMLQPAVATIYEYYEPARRCSRFYNMRNESGLLRKICQEEVCKCAEGKAAPGSRGLLAPPLAPGTRAHHWLLSSASVYKVQLEQREPHNGTVYYSMKVLVVIKSGTDAEANGKVRRFVSHATCEAALGLREQGQYLVIGRTRDLWLSKDSYTYVLGKASFIVPWPRLEETETDRKKKTFLQTLENFAQFLGCDT
ncbi:peroxisome assembly protein 26 [Platysternon megacephalum]|uniref:Peroxisome assembly protein 26 n=1 Tax=Platysternon megacephalum TaxID=55544 RepID=A0A4D9DIQ5_9SAUR|nr:peroxisome assembly protein 26 [Platysternon megacephalum]